MSYYLYKRSTYADSLGDGLDHESNCTIFVQRVDHRDSKARICLIECSRIFTSAEYNNAAKPVVSLLKNLPS